MASRKRKTNRFQSKKSRQTGKRVNNTSSLWPRVFLSLFLAGLCLLFGSVAQRYFVYRSLRMVSASAFEGHAAVRPTLPQQLRVGKTVDAQVEWGVITKGDWTISPDSVTYLTSSARPGERGNVILYGHNKKGILAGLHDVALGDLVEITSENGKKYSYLVSSIQTVNPDAVSLLETNGKEMVTIYTCTGFLDSKRLVVQAVPVGTL